MVRVVPITVQRYARLDHVSLSDEAAVYRRPWSRRTATVLRYLVGYGVFRCRSDQRPAQLRRNLGTDGAAQTMRTYRPHRPQRFRHRAPFRQDSTCPGGDRGQKENRASLPGARTICYDTLASFRSAFICSRATLAAAVSIGSVD